MKKHEIVIIADYSNTEPLSLEELIELSECSTDFIEELIEFGILSSTSAPFTQREFNLDELKRIKTVQHLQRDLEINMAGAAMVLDLLDQLEAMQERIELLEKHFLSL